MPKFLQDKPTKEDKLGGTHNSLSKAMENIIENLSQDLGEHSSIKNIIGLFGSWGSGKSSIIKQLVQKSDNYTVLEFNSWSHKDEFLRRAFLIELTKAIGFEDMNLGEIGFTNTKIEKIKTLDYLSKKNITKTLEVNPQSDFKGLGWFGGLLLFLVSIKIIGIDMVQILGSRINLLFDLDFFVGLKKFYTGHSSLFYFILIILLILLPLLYSTPLKIKKILNFKGFVNYLLFKKIDYSENITSSEKEDFSNYDYQEYFTSIVRKYLLKYPEKKLIIVLDNLDRVDDNIVLNSISLIQTTIEGIKNDTEFRKLLFILPIDKSRLKEVFEKLIKIENTNDEDNFKDNFTEGFIDKTFSVIIDIPTLEQSNWREFFKQKFEEAFGDSFAKEEKMDLDDLIANFYSSTRDAKKGITPREIINFINELISNYNYWILEPDKIPFKKQREYIGYKRYKFNNEKSRKDWIKENLDEIDIIKQIYKTKDIYNILYLNDFIINLKNGDIVNSDEIRNKIETKTNKDTLLQNSFDDILGGNVDMNILGNLFNVIFSLNNIPDNYKNKLRAWAEDEDGYYPSFVENINKIACDGILKLIAKYKDIKHIKRKLPKSIIGAIVLSQQKETNG